MVTYVLAFLFISYFPFPFHPSPSTICIRLLRGLLLLLLPVIPLDSTCLVGLSTCNLPACPNHHNLCVLATFVIDGSPYQFHAHIIFFLSTINFSLKDFRVFLLYVHYTCFTSINSYWFIYSLLDMFRNIF